MATTTEPKKRTRAENIMYRQACVDSHEQELTEIRDWANNVKDFYWNEHRGTWIVQYKNGLEDDEFDSKDDMMKFLESDSRG